MGAVKPPPKPAAKPAPPPSPEDDIEMGFFEHIAELRTRLLRALYGVVPCVFVTWAWKEQLLDLVLRPLRQAYQHLGIPGDSINFSNPVDPFMAFMQVSIISGLLLATPWVFYQVWAFIAPGLYRRERLLAIPFVLFSTLFFAGGAIFGYLIVLPAGFETLLGFAGQLPSGMQFEPEIMIDQYLGFATRMLLAFGVVFEVPVVVTFLAVADMVTWRQLVQFGRWWLVIAAVISAILTPPDVASQTMMLVPLLGLYFLSVGIAIVVQTARSKKTPESDA